MEKENITVACVGDSITYGLTIDNPENNSYPNQLQLLLGPKYVVNPNLGRCGAGIWHRGAPYTSTQEFKDATKWPADILVCCLGTNDAIYHINDDFKREFMEDYKSLVHQLTKHSPKEKVFLCLVPPTPGLKDVSSAILTVNDLVKEVANQCDSTLIDLHAPFTSKDDLFSDGVHPNKLGAGVIAKILYQTIIKLDEIEKTIIRLPNGAVVEEEYNKVENKECITIRFRGGMLI